MTDAQIIAFARAALDLADPIEIRVSPLGARGSDRAYFRCIWGKNQSAVVVHYDPKRIENAYHADIALFLQETGIPTPRMIAHDRGACLIVMEDLGGTDLWSLRNEAWNIRRLLYRKTLAVVHRLHSLQETNVPSSLALMEAFGPALYEWERNYFADHFVKGVCGIDLNRGARDQLEEELAALADHIGCSARCLVHRDLQSQNVMIRSGEPFLIDFQGMRLGSLFYDLGSLLCDPYVVFSDQERSELLRFYYDLSPRTTDWAMFQTFFWEASAQRLMQALGAYGFLGLTRNLRRFLDHIPAGLANLLLAASRAKSLPTLHALCVRCREVIEPGA